MEDAWARILRAPRAVPAPHAHTTMRCARGALSDTVNVLQPVGWSCYAGSGYTGLDADSGPSVRGMITTRAAHERAAALTAALRRYACLWTDVLPVCSDTVVRSDVRAVQMVRAACCSDGTLPYLPRQDVDWYNFLLRTTAFFCPTSAMFTTTLTLTPHTAQRCLLP